MFDAFKQVSVDPILEVNARAKTDTHPQMVNLSIGEYKNAQGGAHVPGTIQEAMRSLPTDNFGYTPAAGLADYLDATGKLILQNFDKDRTAMQATVGGTGALSLLQQMIGKSQHRRANPIINISNPTRGNHNAIFGTSGDKFSHLTPKNEINMPAYKNTMLQNTDYPLLIQGGLTHNPTGINFSYKQLEEIVNVARDKKIQIILDMAYFGLGQTFADDKKRASLIWDNVDDVAMTVSYSKNASLYNMRTGALLIKTTNKEAVESHLQQLYRANVSTAPATGQQIIANVVNDPNKLEQREHDVDFMRNRLQQTRSSLVDALDDPRFAYIRSGAGLFAMLPLTPQQVEQLASEYHIYILPSGRINIAGVNKNNIEYIADSIRAVL